MIGKLSDCSKLKASSSAKVKLSEGFLPKLIVSSSLNEKESDIGLSNVDNTSDADKPISDATQTALDDLQQEIASDAGLSENGLKALQELLLEKDPKYNRLLITMPTAESEEANHGIERY